MEKSKQRKQKWLGVLLAFSLSVSMGACDSDEIDEMDTFPIPTQATVAVSESQAVEQETETSEKATISAPVNSTPPATMTTPAKSETDSTFEVHFIDVGQADSALVLCDEEAMLIDGGNVADSSLIYSYLENHGIDHLEYMVCTHAHEDHVGGLSGALNYATVDTVYCPVTEYDSKAFSNFTSYVEKQGKTITIPSAGDTFSLGSAEVTILAPITEATDANDTSIVLRIVYGETSFLFTGDAEREEEQDILDAGYTLNSTVLKVGHHGSDTSTSYPFLREIMPQYAVISVGDGNSYGHPTENTLSRLRDADVKVYRTDMQGHIICKSDGQNVTFTVERNENADTLGLPDNSTANTPEPTSTPTPTPTPESTPSGKYYILNTDSKKFHDPDCGTVKRISDENREYYTGTAEELVDMGYTPCGNCEPYVIPTPTPAQTQKTTTSDEVMVWIPSSGTKYHSKSSCSNMKDPKEVTKSQAIAKGYTACKRCW